MAMSTTTLDGDTKWLLNITPATSGFSNGVASVSKTLKLSTSDAFPSNNHVAYIDKDIAVRVSKPTAVTYGTTNTNWKTVSQAGFIQSFVIGNDSPLFSSL